jgi:hypothetical protein
MGWTIGSSIPGMGHRVHSASGAHPVFCAVGTGGSFPGVKRPGREADHSPPSIAEVKNAWSYTYTSPIRLHGTGTFICVNNVLIHCLTRKGIP